MAYLIFIIAFLIRLIYIIQLRSSIFNSRFLLDQAFYHNWARGIASGDWLGERVFDALPLYPYFLGVIYKFLGSNLFIPRLIAITLSSFSCVLIYQIAFSYAKNTALAAKQGQGGSGPDKEKLSSAKLAAIAAGLIACFYGPFIFYSGLLVPATIAVILYLLSLRAFGEAVDKPAPLRFFLFGLIVGLAALAKAGILLFLPAVLIWMIISFKERAVAGGPANLHTRPAAMLGALMALLGTLFVILPVTLRNYLVSGDLVFLTSHSGINFYIGNNENADGRFKAPQWARTNIEGLQLDARTIAERELGQPLKDSEVSRFYFGKGLNFIKREPLKFLKLLGRKVFLFVNRQELFDVAHYQVYREHIPILKFPFIGFLLTGVLGFAGMLVGISSWRKAAPLYLFAVTYAVSILAYFINSRYRLPFAIPLIIFAGFFISWVIERWRQKSYLALLLAAVLTAALTGLVGLPTGIETASCGYANLGSIYMDAGEWDEAAAAFNKAIELNPSDPQPYNDIGYIYTMQNRLEEAERSLRVSLSRNPQYPFAHINLGLLHEKRAGLSSAEREYKEAIRLNPNIPEAHNNLANIYEKTNRRLQAIEEYKRAIELDPANAKTHYNLGVIYGRQGRLDEARREFEKASQLDPGFKPARSALSYFKDVL